jgi:hypothetical protein
MPGSLPDKADAALPKAAGKARPDKTGQGVHDHDDGPAPRRKEFRRAADKVVQHRFPGLSGEVGEDEVPGFLPRQEGFRAGLNEPQPVAEGVAPGKDPGQFVPVLGAEAEAVRSGRG